MSESFRKQDMAAEQQLALFLDRCFWSRLTDKAGQPVPFERVTDRDTQLTGIDVILRFPGQTICIDEKASLYYCNRNLPTFAFELDLVQPAGGTLLTGWFLKKTLKTDRYLLIWPNVVCEKQGRQWVRKDIAQLEEPDFTVAEACLLSKEKLKKYLREKGLDDAQLQRRAVSLRRRASAEEKVQLTEKLGPGLKLMYSGQLAEEPVNLIIRKDLLFELSEHAYLISHTGLGIIK